MRLIIFILALLGDIWCIIPIFTFGIFNIGNGTGIAVFTIIMLAALWWKTLRVVLCKLLRGESPRKKKHDAPAKHSKILKFVSRLALCVVMLTAILVIIESVCIISATAKTPDGTETIVVLGSKVNRYGPSLMTAKRLDAAYDYMLKNPDAVCILSGGQGSDEPWPEARGMCDYLIKKGIDESRLYLESESTDTRENLKYSMELIKSKGLNEKIAIVSNEFHLYRAELLAREYGISFSTISAPSVTILFPTYYIRELYAILAEWILY